MAQRGRPRKTDSPDTAGDGSQARVEATARSVPKDYSSLPDELVDHFGSQNVHVSLDSMHESSLTRNSLDERYPLTDKDFPESLREGMVALLTRSGCRHGADGTFRRGDCYIYLQAETARDAQLARGWRGGCDRTP